MEIEEFNELTRDQMYEYLKSVAPSQASGHSRSTKAVLKQIYQVVVLVRRGADIALAEGRLPGETKVSALPIHEPKSAKPAPVYVDKAVVPFDELVAFVALVVR